MIKVGENISEIPEIDCKKQKTQLLNSSKPK